MQEGAGSFDRFVPLFGIAFLLGTLFLVGLCVFTLAGSTVVTRRSNRLSIFTGVAGIGWTRNYSWPDFNSAREEAAFNSFNWSRRGGVIVLEGKHKVTFGIMWSTERRYFVVNVLRAMLSQSSGYQPSVATTRFR